MCLRERIIEKAWTEVGPANTNMQNGLDTAKHLAVADLLGESHDRFKRGLNVLSRSCRFLRRNAQRPMHDSSVFGHIHMRAAKHARNAVRDFALCCKLQKRSICFGIQLLARQVNVPSASIQRFAGTRSGQFGQIQTVKSCSVRVKLGNQV